MVLIITNYYTSGVKDDKTKGLMGYKFNVSEIEISMSCIICSLPARYEEPGQL